MVGARDTDRTAPAAWSLSGKARGEGNRGRRMLANRRGEQRRRAWSRGRSRNQIGFSCGYHGMGGWTKAVQPKNKFWAVWGGVLEAGRGNFSHGCSRINMD